MLRSNFLSLSSGRNEKFPSCFEADRSLSRIGTKSAADKVHGRDSSLNSACLLFPAEGSRIAASWPEEFGTFSNNTFHD